MREGWPSVGLPLAFFFGLGVALVSPSFCGLEFAFLPEVEGCPCFCQTDPRSEGDPNYKKEASSQPSSSGWCCVFSLLLSGRAPVPLLLFLPSWGRSLMVLHMPASTVHQQRLKILTTPVTLHVSRVSALTTCAAHVELLSLWRGYCQGMGLRKHLATTFSLQTFVSPVVRKNRVCRQPWTSVHATRTGGDRLTLMYVSTLKPHCVHLLHIYLSHSTYMEGALHSWECRLVVCGPAAWASGASQASRMDSSRL